VFAVLTPHRQLLAQKWASPFFGFAHPPPFGGGETIKYGASGHGGNKVENAV